MPIFSKAIPMAAALALGLLLTACGDDKNGSANEPPVIRGLKTTVVKAQERSTERKYPSVLQPSSISTLSFEIAGNLAEFKLDVGQIVRKGDVLARINPTTLMLQVESAEAAMRQAQSAAQTSAQDYERNLALLKKGIVTKAAADKARNEAQSAKEKLVQAKKQLETANENLTKAVLKAPFDGIINTVEVNSFANVSPGATIATIYSVEAFEASFTVTYDVINLLTIGKKATIRLADNPAISLDAHVSELGARADTVSSFPAVVRLNSSDTSLKAGMAVEISLEFPIEKGTGYLLPLTVLDMEGQIEKPARKDAVGQAYVYVYDKATATVNRRAVTISGVRENSLIIVDGLQLGEHVASAGVSFLRDGQSVKLLSDTTGE